MTARRERVFVIALCAIAALRVTLFALGFPFFNNVDERAHVDLALKYAQHSPPRKIGNYSTEAARLFAIYSTPEYFLEPNESGLTLVWTLPPNERDATIAAIEQAWTSKPNHESGEPPLYYALAGAVLDIVRAVGIRGIAVLYSIRLCNVAIAAALVWIGYAAARFAFPERTLARCAVPLLIAMWPQTTFYSVQSDALTPLLFGLAFLGWIKFARDEHASATLAALIGLAVAGACLTKVQNLVLLPILCGAMLIATQRKRSLRLTSRLVALSAFALCGALPLTASALRNRATFGDFTATRAKIDMLGWTPKPLNAWLDHPLFTLNGAWKFFDDLLGSFWRGEFLWHGTDLLLRWADHVWTLSSAAFLLIALASLLPRLRVKNAEARIIWFALVCLVTLIGTLVLLSIKFDFGNCIYPSRDWPFFSSGRLLNAAAVPYFIIVARGVDSLGQWLRLRKIDIFILAALVLATLAAQLILDLPALSSPYNFFHAPHGELAR